MKAQTAKKNEEGSNQEGTVDEEDLFLDRGIEIVKTPILLD